MASDKIKQQLSGRANSGWGGLCAEAMAQEERVKGYPCSWQVPAGRMATGGCRRAQGAGGTARDGIGAQIAVRDLGRRRGVPYQSKHPALDDSGTVSPLVPVSWGWGLGQTQGHLGHPKCPLSYGEPRSPYGTGPSVTALRASVLVGGKPGAPRAQEGSRGEVPWGRTQRSTPGWWDTWRLPESTRRTWLGVAACPPPCLGLGCLGKGPGAPRPAPHLPQAPFPSWKEKRNRK